MPGLSGDRNPNIEITPWRKTHIMLSNPDTVLASGPFSVQRSNGAIAADGLRPDNNRNIFRLNAGGFCLRPMSVDAHYLRERSDNAGAIAQSTDFNLAVGVGALPGFRSPADLPGVTVDPNVAATGNNFLRKSVTPSLGQTFFQSLIPDGIAFPTPALPTSNVPLDRLAVSKISYPANQGYYFTFMTPSHRMGNQDFLGAFYFGGQCMPDGSGQYCLALGGEGQALLCEFINGTWVKRDKWQYTLPQRYGGVMESVMIFPYTDTISGNSYIEFRSGLVDAAPSVHNIVSVAAEAVWHAQGAPSTHLYTCAVKSFSPRAVNVPPPPPRLSATGMGPCRVDIRRDLRMPWQVAFLRFAATGQLTDLPFFVSQQLSPAFPLTLAWSGNIPDGTVLDAKLFDAKTGTELTVASTGVNLKTYTAAIGQSHLYAVFYFTAANVQSLTPILTTYRVYRDAQYATLANSPTEMLAAGGGKLASRVARSVNISGPEDDPSHETANIAITDITGSLTQLSAHSFVPIRVEVEYDPADATKRSVLFQGYVTRAEAKRWGTVGKTGLGGGGATKLYPSAAASDYDVRCVGQWARLRKAFCGNRQPLMPDPKAPVNPKTGIQPAFKVTEILRAAFGWAGYSADMIDVPDHPMRFFPPANGDPDSLCLDPLTNLADFIEKTAADYLGWWIIFDPNAGVGNKGMWRAMPPTLAPYTNLAAFVGGAAANKRQTVPQSYGSTNWVGTAGTPIQCPIFKGSLTRTPKAPEANKVIVTGTGALLPNKGGQLSLYQTATNLASYSPLSDGNGNPVITADLNSPDWLGFESLLIYVDTTLQNQRLVDIVCRRLYNFTCHGTTLSTFEAPLVLVTDPKDTKQIRPRPLRYYDPVTIFGVQYLVRSVNPFYRFDGKQMARYECETPRF
jgi:hypothetical protein